MYSLVFVSTDGPTDKSASNQSLAVPNAGMVLHLSFRLYYHPLSVDHSFGTCKCIPCYCFPMDTLNRKSHSLTMAEVLVTMTYVVVFCMGIYQQ
jgi:hypothetical protein